MSVLQKINIKEINVFCHWKKCVFVVYSSLMMYVRRFEGEFSFVLKHKSLWFYSLASQKATMAPADGCFEFYNWNISAFNMSSVPPPKATHCTLFLFLKYMSLYIIMFTSSVRWHAGFFLEPPVFTHLQLERETISEVIVCASMGITESVWQKFSGMGVCLKRSKIKCQFLGILSLQTC